MRLTRRDALALGLGTTAASFLPFEAKQELPGPDVTVSGEGLETGSGPDLDGEAPNKGGNLAVAKGDVPMPEMRDMNRPGGESRES